ncbi:MAG: hypothetical protein H7A25_22130 [Leptospiraceae bacterium]|nr:hypothetical protein [Leptospiraceae bacterium]MCP5502613.1 hypothetical protein [Leptospiraceae bacterium]
MIIRDFIQKYELPPAEAEGLLYAAQFYARTTFDEKLLILIYIKTFGVFPGGIDEETLANDVSDLIKEFIDDSVVSETKTWSSKKIKESLKPLSIEFQEASSEWQVVHNLGYEPGVNIIINSEVVLADVKHLSENSLQVVFAHPQTGKLILF